MARYAATTWDRPRRAGPADPAAPRLGRRPGVRGRPRLPGGRRRIRSDWNGLGAPAGAAPTSRPRSRAPRRDHAPAVGAGGRLSCRHARSPPASVARGLSRALCRRASRDRAGSGSTAGAARRLPARRPGLPAGRPGDRPVAASAVRRGRMSRLRGGQQRRGGGQRRGSGRPVGDRRRPRRIPRQPRRSARGVDPDRVRRAAARGDRRDRPAGADRPGDARRPRAHPRPRRLQRPTRRRRPADRSGGGRGRCAARVPRGRPARGGGPQPGPGPPQATGRGDHHRHRAGRAGGTDDPRADHGLDRLPAHRRRRGRRRPGLSGWAGRRRATSSDRRAGGPAGPRGHPRDHGRGDRQHVRHPAGRARRAGIGGFHSRGHVARRAPGLRLPRARRGADLHSAGGARERVRRLRAVRASDDPLSAGPAPPGAGTGQRASLGAHRRRARGPPIPAGAPRRRGGRACR